MDKTCSNCKFRGKTYKPNKTFDEPIGCTKRECPWYYHETVSYFSCSHWEEKIK